MMSFYKTVHEETLLINARHLKEACKKYTAIIAKRLPQVDLIPNFFYFDRNLEIKSFRREAKLKVFSVES